MAEIMNAEAVWQEDLRFNATTGTGHEIVLDAAEEFGGKDAGPQPIELLLAGYAACTGMDVMSILKKMRQPVTGYRVRVTGERRDEQPRIFTKIMIEHVVQGDLDEDKVAHAVELSEEKYCSVSAMLKQAAEIEVKWTIEREA
jgi:putative redox protein